MLLIKNLSAEVEGKVVLDSVTMDFELGKNYCILGKNGSGKSSLAMTVMGHPKYQLTVNNGQFTDVVRRDDILNDNQSGIFLVDESDCIDDVTKVLLHTKGIQDLNMISLVDLDPNLRSKLGIFVAFQNIPEIKGVKLFEFLRTIYNARWVATETFISFKKVVEPLCEELGIERDFLRRDINVGFSGGERRKIEILQLKLLKPRYIFLDEVDSGLDVDAFRNVAKLLSDYDGLQNSFIVITHYFQILDYLPIDQVYLIQGGKIIGQGGVELALRVKEKGFGE